MRRLIRYFLQGLLYIAPLAVTVYIIVVSIVWIDSLLRDRAFFQEGFLSKYNFPGLGLILILMLVTLIGYVGQRMISSPISLAYDKTMKKAPLVKMIYTSVKDLLSAFVGGEKKFNQPVIVKLDEAGLLHRFGFITSNNLSNLGLDDMVGVYLPSSYGMLGEMYAVPKKQIIPLKANSADVMKYIVSGGVSEI
ncbi:Uncharacterized membrane protein [Saccharicrinis carchari]|uniref:Uncharacterized membrane protein n=1 Tax=Saccharicrinis carchari TaxID=1168039 RepID=A0A521DFG1_SACCC|nr:DUF502 domain-containing protein [Saccharicrinis carchari]SMO70459.1 Uncharacterized membrane protein [Saccharicrinis carchari]